MSFTERTEMLLGSAALDRLRRSSVLVLGLGGVGGMLAETLVRAGIGRILVADAGVVTESNLNRQILADIRTVGRRKAEVFSERAKSINPQIEVVCYSFFIDENTADGLDFNVNYVADAIDTISAKLLIAKICAARNTPLISCMGTGNKLDPSAFRVADITQTRVCPVARAMRKGLKDMGLEHLKVVYSEEAPAKIVIAENGRHAPASVPFVPPAAALLMAAEIVRELIG